jgi:hypothetical protein
MVYSVVISGVMVSVRVIGPKGRGVRPGRGDGFLWAIKICSTPSFGWEAKQSAPCRKILRHVNISLRSTNKETSKGQIHYFLRPVPPALLLDDSACSTVGELWWTNPEYSSVDIIPSWFSMLICHLGDEQ